MADDLYIEMLRYGREHLGHGVTIADTRTHLRKLHSGAELVESETRFGNTFGETFLPIAGADNPSGIQMYSLKMEGYFNLLEHEELNEARRSSRNALRVAIAALVISGILSAVSIFVQLAPSVWLPWTG